MQIVTLIENMVYDQGLTAEHGLSLYLESGNKKIVFDTGQTGNFVNNAVRLGVDISTVTDLVISHGHYDHTGGILNFIKNNNHAKIHIKRQAFIKKYRTNKTDSIGIPFDPDFISERINFIDKKTEISSGVFIMPEIIIYEPEDLHYDGMFIKNADQFIPDKFDDELFLAVVNEEKLTIVSGCSHNGIINICETAANQLNLKFNTILGGFHLMNSNEAHIRLLSEYFKKINPEKIGVCHCTGIDKFAILKNILGKKVFYNYTGKKIII